MKVFKNFDLTEYNSYKLNSISRIAYFPESESDFLDFFCNEGSNGYFLIGNGNNIIFSKKYYHEPFIILNGTFNEIISQSSMIIAQSGATTKDLSIEALKQNLSGAEFLYDIPSSIGGAVVMNAGTKEGETRNILHKVRYLDLNDLKIKEKYNYEMELSYRNSYFQNKNDMIVLKAWFQFEKGDYSAIKLLMEKSKERRWSMQPREFPNCGSVFKRPPGRFVGPMIDELGLKGYSVGGAEVSSKHSGFIVNKGGATGDDVLELIRIVSEKVKHNFGIELVVEQRII